MTSPSPLVQDAWVQWADRGALVRRDVSMVLAGCYGKSRFLKDLREKIHEHRREDLLQLGTARRESWERWDERLVRLERWIASAEILNRSSNNLLDWRDAAEWFDRAQDLAQRYASRLERNIESLEKRLLEVASRLGSWQNRLMIQEDDVRGFFERQTAKSTEILVSASRKRPYQDFVYAEREEEGHLAVSLREIARQAGRTLERLSAAEAKLAAMADKSPAHFEVRRRQLLEGGHFLRERLASISEMSVNQGLVLEDGRQRLRGIYEKIQRMRVLPEAPPRARPFLYRLFNISDE